MSLVISDLHGNYTKCKCFIDYRKDENIEKIILGDFMDSYHATDEDIVATFKLAVDSGCVLTAGNHELHYFFNAHSYFRCSGQRFNPALQHAVEMYKDLLHGSLIRDGHLLCHGGLSAKHGKRFTTLEEAHDWINGEWDWYKSQPVPPETLSSIFDIGSVRGGYQDISGIFWCSIGYEKLDTKFNQVVGHTPKEAPIKMLVGRKKVHIGIDSPKFICYNTVTMEFEDFYPIPGHDDQMRKMLERKY
jgi:hypothetical protein